MKTRKCAVAGTWYPSNRHELLSVLQELDSKCDNNTTLEIDSAIGLIAPHAGYIYSGKTAALGFKTISRFKFDTVVLLGTSHRFNAGTIGLFAGDDVETPIGNLSIDTEFVNSLMLLSNAYSKNTQIHEKEHSLEAMFPFIRHYLGSPAIVPVLTATNDEEILEEAGFALVDAIKKSHRKILVIASTDMSHFHAYEIATSMDKAAVDFIENGDYANLTKAVRSGKIELCGYHALVMFFIAMQELGRPKGRLIHYENSGDAVPGSRSNGVVGYMSAVY